MTVRHVQVGWLVIDPGEIGPDPVAEDIDLIDVAPLDDYDGHEVIEVNGGPTTVTPLPLFVGVVS